MKKIAETIYTPFQNGHFFYLFLPCPATFEKQFSKENDVMLELCNKSNRYLEL
jgi:hypothetical protein